MAMTNGSLLQVLQRREDGWWYVRVKAQGMKVGRSVDKAPTRGLFVVQNETGYVRLTCAFSHRLKKITTDPSRVPVRTKGKLFIAARLGWLHDCCMGNDRN